MCLSGIGNDFPVSIIGKITAIAPAGAIAVMNKILNCIHHILYNCSLETQRALFIKGWERRIAPSTGHSITQQPQYQHSPGKRTIGGFPFSELGIRISTWQMFTQMLHPIHFSSSKYMGLFTGISLG
jgi:hypothetical protein